MRKIDRLITEHRCELVVTYVAALDGRPPFLRATYNYGMREADCRFHMLSEVGEPVVVAFEKLLRRRGLTGGGIAEFPIRSGSTVGDVLVPAANAAGRRWLSLMPGGVPKKIRCYDNGGMDAGGTFDRYTVLYLGKVDDEYHYVGMSAEPFHPQGHGQHGSDSRMLDVPKRGRSALGKRIHFEDLPIDCRRLVTRDYISHHNL